MAVSAVQILDPRDHGILSTDSFQLRWYAAYTCANHEKRVREQLEQRSVESFLPVYETIRRWKDRRMHFSCLFFRVTYSSAWRWSIACACCKFRVSFASL